MSMKSKIVNWFTFHAPNGDDIEKYNAIRESGKSFAYAIDHNCPDCADKTAAIRKVREAVMTANASIACGGE